MGCKHWAVTATLQKEGPETQDIVASVTSWALKHLHRNFTMGQEKQHLLGAMKLQALLLTSSKHWLRRIAPEGAGL